MIMDVQLVVFTNMLSTLLFYLVIHYHYLAISNPKSRNESGIFSTPGFQDIV
uniref:Dolichyl-diphosphooligosaccharide--protein glycosyltransferase subunit 4 n=1 Tax=Sciurus vulgaris TaxID=55149 RepID=A0A8D2CVR0_SCIVU